MIRLGVTGHRPNRLVVPEQRLENHVDTVLSNLAAASSAGGPDRHPVLEVNSALAEGADRIVARRTLALGQRLTALLPFARRDYETTFGDAARTGEFRTLLAQADARIVLAGSLRRAEAAYVAVGMVTLARSDIVLAIWDGKPAQGRGGTTQILENAVAWGIPVLWIDAVRDREPVLLVSRPRGKTMPALADLAGRAAALDRAAYRALVASCGTA